MSRPALLAVLGIFDVSLMQAATTAVSERFPHVTPALRGPKGLWRALVISVMDGVQPAVDQAVIDLGDGDAHLAYLARVTGGSATTR